MHCNKVCLHIDTCSTLVRRTDKNFFLTCPHLLKKCIPLCVGLCIMDKCYLICRNTILDKCFLQIIIDGKVLIRSRCADIRKNKLAAYMTISISFLIFFPYILRYLIELSIRIVWCIFINQSGIRSKKSCLMGNLQEVIHTWINSTASDTLCPHNKVFHDLLHIPVRLRLHNNRLAATESWHIKVKHVCGLHISYFTKDIHKLRQIRKLIKSALKTESASLYSKLQCCCHFTKVRCPRIKVIDSHLFKCRFL